MTNRKHTLSRRTLLHRSGAVIGGTALLSGVPSRVTAMLGPRPEPVGSIRDPRIKELAQKALDAARSTGAEYADVRLTHTRHRTYGVSHLSPAEGEVLHVGVRALVKGYWAGSASPVWSADEMVRLGREAAENAKINARGRPRGTELAPVSVVREAHWETPIKIDPFEVHRYVIVDYLADLEQQLLNELGRLDRFGWRGETPMAITTYSVVSQARAFGATSGTYCTQRIVRSTGTARAQSSHGSGSAGRLFTPQGCGWELFTDNDVIGTVMRSLHERRELMRLPVKPIEVGRYATVFDAFSVANLLRGSIGMATQIDRALGYEANAGGTSYLIEPEEMLGSFAIGNSLLSVSANRSEPGACATVRWDDEGVEPDGCQLVERGVLSDFQTSREGAGWLRGAYERLGRPFRSHGHMASDNAWDFPAIQIPNLVMQPSTEDHSYREVEASIDKGMSVIGLSPMMDFQLSGGFSNGFGCFEIKNGERVAIINGAGILFRTSELWKAITAIGGVQSTRRFGMISPKGSSKETYHSVTAVPMAIKEMTFIDRERR